MRSPNFSIISQFGRLNIKNMTLSCHHLCASKNRGTPKSSILIRFSIINHPFWGTPISGNIHLEILFGAFHSLGIFLRFFKTWKNERRTEGPKERMGRKEKVASGFKYGNFFGVSM